MADTTHSPRALAVAIVAMSKAISSTIPGYAKDLEFAAANAERAGMSAEDLAILRLMIRSASPIAPPD